MSPPCCSWSVHDAWSGHCQSDTEDMPTFGVSWLWATTCLVQSGVECRCSGTRLQSHWSSCCYSSEKLWNFLDVQTQFLLEVVVCCFLFILCSMLKFVTFTTGPSVSQTDMYVHNVCNSSLMFKTFHVHKSQINVDRKDVRVCSKLKFVAFIKKPSLSRSSRNQVFVCHSWLMF